MSIKFKNWQKLGLSFLAVFTTATVGSAFTFDSVKTWYPTLVKPWFSPPNYLFGPVWTFLYFLMAVSLYLVWQKADKTHSRQIKIFILHLAINAFWSIAFFGLKSPLLGLVVILILWGMIVYLIKKFYKINKTSGLLLIPYLLWVSFATLLNFSLVVLNL